MGAKPNWETMNHEARRRQNESNNRHAQLRRIYLRDGGICQLCGRHVEREDASRDHIKDFALCTKEEARDENNIQLAHRRCNEEKHMKASAKQRTIRDSAGRPLLTQSLGSLFPNLSYMFPEADG